MLRNSFDQMVEVIVGPGKDVFHVHKSLICDSSDFFKAALSGNFKEGTAQRVELPEDDPAVFKDFNYWLYTEKLSADLEIADIRSDKDKISKQNSNEVQSNLNRLLGLYIFADAKMVFGLHNLLIDAFIDAEYNLDLIPTNLLKRIYENLPQDAKLKLLFVDLLLAWSPNGDGFFQSLEWARQNYPFEFLFDFGRRYAELGNQKKTIWTDFRKNRAHYHI